MGVVLEFSVAIVSTEQNGGNYSKSIIGTRYNFKEAKVTFYRLTLSYEIFSTVTLRYS